MRIGYVQTEPVFGKPPENLRLVEERIEAEKSDLWVLPELFSTGYLFEGRKELAAWPNRCPKDPRRRDSSAWPRDSVPPSSPESPSARRTDASSTRRWPSIHPASRRATERVHLFDYEKEWFDPGDGPFVVVTLAGARVGLMICWDWRFPESARTLALAGAQVIAHPSNLVLPFCQAAMVTRAIENRVFTITANRIGTEQRAGLRLAFTGGSRIVAPDGSILSDGPAGATASASVEIDPGVADGKRVTAHNDLFADRRPEFYRLA